MANLAETRTLPHTPPGPERSSLLSMIRTLFIGPRSDVLGYLKGLADAYGDTVHVKGYFSFYMILNPEGVRQVLVEEAAKFYKTALSKQNLGRFLGNGILLSDGDFWKRQRKLVQPAFHHKRIATYAQVMVDHTLRMLDRWQSGVIYDIDQEMMALTLSIVARTLFNSDVSDHTSKVSEAMAIVQEITTRTSRQPVRLPTWMPTRENRRALRALRTLDEILLRVIEERRASGQDMGDLLSMLLLAMDEDDGGQMTDKQVRDEAMTLFLAGHETTANTLTWTWYLLSQNPDVEAKLHAELDSVLGGRAPTLEDLPKLRYTTMVVKESMRIYPPAWITSREAIDDVTINGFPIKKGSLVFVSPFLTQRNPHLFPEPEKFIPERFSEENEKKLPRYAYFPFGGGPRICIGQQFAMMEATLLLATIARRYRLSLVPGHPVEMEPLITLRTRHGLRMKARQREGKFLPQRELSV